MSTLPATRLRAAASLTVALLAVLLVGPSATAASGALTPAGSAWVRVGHFVPGLGTTRIDLTPEDGGTPSVTMTGGAGYGDVTKYRQLEPGTYTATVRDSTASASSAPVLSRSVEVTDGEARTIAVLGSAKQPRLVFLTDDLTPPDAGSSRVRVLSASSKAEDVTVTAVDGPTVATGAVLGQATAYASVPAGAWTLDVEGGSLTAQDSVSLAAGSIYTVVVLDTPRAVRLQVITDAAGASVMPQGGAKTGEGGAAASWLERVGLVLGAGT